MLGDSENNINEAYQLHPKFLLKEYAGYTSC